MAKAWQKLCRECGDAVVKFGMIRPGDLLCCALSGGKDSLVMLKLLSRMREVAPVDFDLIGVTFDPGYPGIGVQKIADFCAACGVEHKSVQLDMARIIAEKNWGDAPCVLCSRLRRGKLYGLVRELGGSALALGHHLDDAIASFFMSLCRGQGITSLAPVVEPQSAGAVRIIRPLIWVEEAMIAAAAAELGIEPTGTCPYEEQLETSGDRAYFRALTDTLAERIPAVRKQILRSFGKVQADFLPGAREDK